jgi:SAM-dependent methyltransferase
VTAPRSVTEQRREEELDFAMAGRERAERVWRHDLRAHPHLTDRDSRLCELVEFFGFEIAQKAPYATPWLYDDDPRKKRYIEEKLGLDRTTFDILHMYALFNRMDPDRHDLYWIYDGLLRRLELLGGPGVVSVLDFGTGLGQIGLAFAAAGYRTVMSDRVDRYLAFARFLAEVRGLDPVFHEAPTDDTFYDTGQDGHSYGLVVEWSTFEHVYASIPALEAITSGLVTGGMFVTTTFCKDWTAAEIEHYRRDSQDAEIAEQYLSRETDSWIRERFDVLLPPKTIAKVLVKR